MTLPDPPGAPDAERALTLRPIGIVRSPFSERMSAPRQPRAADGGEGTLELFPHLGYEHALEDLASFRYIWVLFWFHKNQHFKRKVMPPRSQRRRGVFATRSPYRPNPIGMSALELLGVDGLRLRVRQLDILDGTPILDLKPYIPYTDSIPGADSGWLDEAARPIDPIPRHEVHFTPRARAQLDYLEGRGVVLAASIADVLGLGPTPHPYRRIKANGDGYVLAYKAWRIDFTARDLRIEVQNLRTGYRPSVLANGADADLELHRAFVAAFE